MSDIKVGSPEYKALLRRFNELWDTKKLTKNDRAVMRDIGAQLDAAELAHLAARGEAGQ